MVDLSNAPRAAFKRTAVLRLNPSEVAPVRGQRIVVTAGVPFGTPGATNVLRIAWIEA